MKRLVACAVLLWAARARAGAWTPDAGHGYAVDDSHVYNAAAADKHYAALSRLFGETLR